MGADRKLVFLGLLNRRLQPGQKAILVGGSLVEFYTDGAFQSKDIDLVGDRDAVRPYLLAVGFAEDPRGFEHAELDLIVDMTSKPLRDMEHVVNVRFQDLDVPMVTVEDAIIDRLLAAKYWRSSTDWEQAIVLYAAHQERVSMSDLRDKARHERVEDTLERLVGTVDRGPTAPASDDE